MVLVELHLIASAYLARIAQLTYILVIMGVSWDSFPGAPGNALLLSGFPWDEDLINE